MGNEKIRWRKTCFITDISNLATEFSKSYNMRHNFLPLAKPSQVFLFPSSFRASSSVSCDSSRIFPRRLQAPDRTHTGCACPVMGGFIPALGSWGLEGAGSPESALPCAKILLSISKLSLCLVFSIVKQLLVQQMCFQELCFRCLLILQ